jgi:RHS repeat-associated protein
VRDDQYGYDASGNVTSIDDLLPSNVSNRSMTYDALDRLKTVTAPNMWGTATYGYDALDNLTSTTITGGITARNTLHNINATTNRLDSITNGPPGFNVTYGYDSRGNVTQRNSQVFEYDLADRLKRAVGRATYTYDGFKRRVSVVGTDGVTRVQVYAQDGKLLYVAPSGGTPTKYVYMRNHVLAEVSGSTVTYNHTDALGSPVAQTNAAGAILSRTRYEPYGYIVAGTPRTIGFTGHVNDNDTGLVYMQQRYYDAFAGRFLSVDPVVTNANSGANFNRYFYAANSPYNFRDPDGREPCPGMSANTCIMANSFDVKKSNGQTTVASSEIANAMVAQKSVVAVTADNAKEEKMAFLRPSKEGLTAILASDVKNTSTANTVGAAASKPADAVAVLHGHIDNSMNLVSPGDSQPLKLNLPNGVVSQGRVGVTEIVGGAFTISNALWKNGDAGKT